MKDLQFLGICIIIASTIIGAAIVWHALAQRYQLIIDSDGGIYVQDTITGDTYKRGKNLIWPET